MKFKNPFIPKPSVNPLQGGRFRVLELKPSILGQNTYLVSGIFLLISALLFKRFGLLSFSRRGSKHSEVKKVPASLPLVGNIGLLIPFKNAVKKCQDIMKSFGNIVEVSLFGKQILLLGDIAAIQEVLSKGSEVFRNSHSAHKVLDYLGMSSDLSAQKAGGKSHRRTLSAQSMFFKNTTKMPAAMGRCIDDLINRLKQQELDGNAAIQIDFETANFCAQLTSSMAFGDLLSNDLRAYFFGTDLMNDIDAMHSKASPLALLYHVPFWARWLIPGAYTLEREVIKADKRFTSHCMKAIAEYKAQREEILRQHPESSSLLDSLMTSTGIACPSAGDQNTSINKNSHSSSDAAHDEAVVLRLKRFFLASYHKTALSVAWAVYELCRHPDTLKAVRSEIKSTFASTHISTVIASGAANAVHAIMNIGSSVSLHSTSSSTSAGTGVSSGASGSASVNANTSAGAGVDADGSSTGTTGDNKKDDSKDDKKPKRRRSYISISGEAFLEMSHKLPLSAACLREALRLHSHPSSSSSPATAVAGTGLAAAGGGGAPLLSLKNTSADAVLLSSGVEIAPHRDVICFLYHCILDPKVFPEPHEYTPHRWLHPHSKGSSSSQTQSLTAEMEKAMAMMNFTGKYACHGHEYDVAVAALAAIVYYFDLSTHSVGENGVEGRSAAATSAGTDAATATVAEVEKGSKMAVCLHWRGLAASAATDTSASAGVENH